MKNVNQNKIKFLRARFSLITNQTTKNYPCLIFDTEDNGICMKSSAPLFINDHLKLIITIKQIDYTCEIIITNRLHDYFHINFLAFSKNEQKDIDTLLNSILNKRC